MTQFSVRQSDSSMSEYHNSNRSARGTAYLLVIVFRTQTTWPKQRRTETKTVLKNFIKEFGITYVDTQNNLIRQV